MGHLTNHCLGGQFFAFYYGTVHVCAKKKVLHRKSEYWVTLSGRGETRWGYETKALIIGNSVDPYSLI